MLLWQPGGELQRFAIAVVAAQEADVYMIDEPSSYLDVRQRLKAAQARRCCPFSRPWYLHPSTASCYVGNLIAAASWDVFSDKLQPPPVPAVIM